MIMLKPFEIVLFEDATPQLYEELGFKSGLEVHQQVYTKQKLFCRCPAGVYSKEHDAAIMRHMRPTLSEMGTYDGTALMEFKKQKEVLYLLKTESVCTYEMDDTPPFLVNREAVEKAIKIAMMFGCSIVGELHVMRKQYLDGSIPTGFQRTMVIGVNGQLPLGDGRVVGVQQINLEEDACREVSDVGHRITFRTDRLSMPLIEVITDAELFTPQTAYLAGRRIQALTRSSGLVRTGIGATRQDVNASVAGGSRVEIKGVPRIPYFPKLLHYEAIRQKVFLDLKAEIANRGILQSPDSIRYVELTTNSSALKIPLWQRAERIMGVVVQEFADLFETTIQPGRTFADDVSSILDVVSCLDYKPNMIFKPMPKAGGPNETEWKRMRADFGANDNDLLVVVWGNKRDCQIAAGEIRDRIVAAKDVGVPNETRKAMHDGTTIFERVLPGADRMYPDTDHPPVPLERDYLQTVRAELPQSPWEIEEKWVSAGLSDQLLFELLRSRKAPLLDEIVQKTKYPPQVIAVALTQSLLAFKRAGLDTSKLSYRDTVELFAALSDSGASQESIPHALEMLLRGDYRDRVVQTFTPVDRHTAQMKIEAIIDEKLPSVKSIDRRAKVAAMMGYSMKQLRGKFPGADIRAIVEKRVG
jgi:glutamyl-tRNA(Gln) amidotransferase subunit E